MRVLRFFTENTHEKKDFSLSQAITVLLGLYACDNLKF